MTGSVSVRLVIVLIAGLALPGCELIGDIFQAGMVVGALLVVAAISLIAYLVARVRRRV